MFWQVLGALAAWDAIKSVCLAPHSPRGVKSPPCYQNAGRHSYSPWSSKGAGIGSERRECSTCGLIETRGHCQGSAR
jgi:hypothetical protein